MGREGWKKSAGEIRAGRGISSVLLLIYLFQRISLFETKYSNKLNTIVLIFLPWSHVFSESPYFSVLPAESRRVQKASAIFFSAIFFRILAQAKRRRIIHVSNTNHEIYKRIICIYGSEKLTIDTESCVFLKYILATTTTITTKVPHLIGVIIVARRLCKTKQSRGFMEAAWLNRGDSQSAQSPESIKIYIYEYTTRRRCRQCNRIRLILKIRRRFEHLASHFIKAIVLVRVFYLLAIGELSSSDSRFTIENPLCRREKAAMNFGVNW